jgi:site-specific DNA recombinase
MYDDTATMAAEAGVGGSYFTRILCLSFLAPEVVKAILRDRHPIELTAKGLANEVRLPISWDEQRALTDAVLLRPLLCFRCGVDR